MSLRDAMPGCDGITPDGDCGETWVLLAMPAWKLEGTCWYIVAGAGKPPLGTGWRPIVSHSGTPARSAHEGCWGC